MIVATFVYFSLATSFAHIVSMTSHYVLLHRATFYSYYNYSYDTSCTIYVCESKYSNCVVSLSVLHLSTGPIAYCKRNLPEKSEEQNHGCVPTDPFMLTKPPSPSSLGQCPYHLTPGSLSLSVSDHLSLV